MFHWTTIEQSQKEDPACRLIFKVLTGTAFPTLEEERGEDPETRLLLNLARKGELVLEWFSEGGEEHALIARAQSIRNQMLIPEALRKPFFLEVHWSVGHLGADKTLEMAKRRMWWPRITTMVYSWVKECMVCIEKQRRSLHEAHPIDRQADR